MPFIGARATGDIRSKSGVYVGTPSWLNKSPSLSSLIAEILLGKTAVWFDPNDSSTLFKDAALTPAQVGDPVYLMLDKAQGGLLASPVMVYSQTFDSGTDGWGGLQSTCTQDSGSLKVIGTVNNGTCNAARSIGALVTSKGLYRMTCKVKVNPATVTAINVFTQITAYPYSGTGSMVKTGLTSEWTQVDFLFRVHDYTKGTQINVSTSGTVTGFAEFWVDDVVVTQVATGAGTMLQNTSANRPILRQDAEGKYYLESNGTNQWINTISAIGWSGTDQIACVAYQKTVSGNAIVWETSTNSSGSVTASACFDSQSLVQHRLFSGLLPVLTIAENLTQKRVVAGYRSGSNLTTKLVNTGATGTFTATEVATAQPLNILSRNGASSFFGGRFYGLIILNDTYSSANLALIEKQLAAQSGVTLP